MLSFEIHKKWFKLKKIRRYQFPNFNKESIPAVMVFGKIG